MAQQIQQTRYRQESFHFNAQLPASLLERYCSLTRKGEAKMQDVYVRKQLTARSYHRMLKVARTIADLERLWADSGAALWTRRYCTGHRME